MKTLLALLAGLFAATLGWSYTYILETTNPNSLPLKWDPGVVPVRIMADNTTALNDGLTRATSMQAAAQVWNAVLGDLQFQTQIAPAGPPGRNGINELAFADDVFGQAFGANVLAVTLTRFSGTSRDSDILFDQKDWTWDSYRAPRPTSVPAGVVDLRRVAIHELGHILGLDHPDQAGQTVSAVMNSHASSTVDTLTSDDITGAQNLYGPSPLGRVPANDNFANAAVLTLQFQNGSNIANATGYNTNATKESGEPSHADNAGGKSVWWKWTAPVAGGVTLDTRGSYFDTILAVYTGSSLGNLAVVASNDDLQNDQSGHIQASSVTFNATANTTYYIAVDGFDADSAGITLTLNFNPTAVSITTQPVSQSVTAGGNASFSVSAIGTGNLTYQWFFGNTAIAGATAATFSLTNAQAANAGSYFVTVANSATSVNSDTATLTVNAAPIPTPPPTPAPSGGGGGGGAPSVWFLAALSVLGIGRLLRNRP